MPGTEQHSTAQSQQSQRTAATKRMRTTVDVKGLGMDWIQFELEWANTMAYPGEEVTGLDNGQSGSWRRTGQDGHQS